jgi:hypothetical protein
LLDLFLPAPNCCHDAQLLGDFLERGSFGEPLERSLQLLCRSWAKITVAQIGRQERCGEPTIIK